MSPGFPIEVAIDYDPGTWLLIPDTSRLCASSASAG